MRYKDTLHLAKRGRHELRGPVPACAARFGIATFLWTSSQFRILHEFGKVPPRKAITLIRRPRKKKLTTRLVGQDLKYSGGSVIWESLRQVIVEALIKELKLPQRHIWCSAPVCPVGFVKFIIVALGIEVNSGMYETEDEAFRGPINDDVHSHIIGINS
jgi:hypothetical protein